MKQQDTKRVNIVGPFYEFSTPFGFATLERDVWYVSRFATATEKRKSAITKILGTVSLGAVLRFRSSPQRYCIDKAYPNKYFRSLQKAVEYLAKETHV